MNIGRAAFVSCSRSKGSSSPGLCLARAKLSRNSNQVVRGRIRQIAVGTLITERPPHRTERAPLTAKRFVTACRMRSRDDGPALLTRQHELEQKLDEARQVEITDLSHPPLDSVLAILDRGLGNRLRVAVGLELREIEPIQKIGS
jgi:hypothetical protein